MYNTVYATQTTTFGVCMHDARGFTSLYFAYMRVLFEFPLIHSVMHIAAEGIIAQ